MGRWAQRQIRGGGPPLPPTSSLITDFHVTEFDPGIAHVTFSQLFDIGDFTPDNFTDSNSGSEGDEINFEEDFVMQVIFNGPISPGHTWHYVGTAPGVLSPQSGTMT